MDGQTEKRTPMSHPATSRCDKKWGLRGSKLYKQVFMMITHVNMIIYKNDYVNTPTISDLITAVCV